MEKYYHINVDGNKSYSKNILEKYDKFIPTENILG